MLADARVDLCDVGQDLLPGAIGPRDQYWHIGVRYLRCHGNERVHRIAFIHDSTKVEAFRKVPSSFLPLVTQLLRFGTRGSQIQQVAHCGEQTCVVPRFGNVIGRACAHQFHRRLQVGPCREQDDRQIREAAANLPEKGDSLLAAGGFAPEVHVLDDQVDSIQRGQRLFG